MTEKIENVDDLQYDWPANVVSYDTRYFLGLSMQELMLIAGFGIGALLINLFLAPVGAVLGFLMVKRFEGLGDRRVPQYALAYLLYRARDRTVTLPRLLPTEEIQVTITDMDGNLIASFGDEL
jgi:hypothetical protein